MAEFDRYREKYEQEIDGAIAFAGMKHDFYTRVKADFLAGLFLQRFGGDQALQVLDVGCGNGKIHPMLLERRHDLTLTGTDVAAETIAQAAEDHPTVRYDAYDGLTLPYPDKTFHAAFTICVMHHVPREQWLGLMKEMRRVLRTDGILSVIEHNPWNPVTRRIVNTCPLDKNAVLLSSSQTRSLFREAGFEDIACRYILFTPLPHRAFRKLDRWLWPIPLGAQYVITGQARDWPQQDAR